MSYENRLECGYTDSDPIIFNDYDCTCRINTVIKTKLSLAYNIGSNHKLLRGE